MILLAIDPGPEKSGVLAFDIDKGKILLAEESDLGRVRWLITGYHEVTIGRVACEDVTPQLARLIDGKPTVQSPTVLETMRIVGRVEEVCYGAHVPFYCIARRDVIRALSLGRANDALVKAELESRGWVKGTKKNPGPAYGVKGHAWQALALAVAWLEMQKVKA